LLVHATENGSGDAPPEPFSGLERQLTTKMGYPEKEVKWTTLGLKGGL